MAARQECGAVGVLRTDAVIGDLPLIYPFLVNDPGEGAQAKRRAHAVLVDHLIPPMARAEAYGDIARLEQLLDEYANVSAMDPAKAPAVRAQIWTLLHAAEMHRDLGLEERPDDDEFDDFVMHIDGWLCEIKDAQIRDGLHILGQAPDGGARVNLVLAILRAAQVWGGEAGAVPGLRAALGLRMGRPAPRSTPSKRRRVNCSNAWRPAIGAVPTPTSSPKATAEVARVLRFAAEQVVPRLAGTAGELDAVLHALEGGFIPAGPSGSPLRGLVNVLPTGRNFYTVDPRAVPSRLAYETGLSMADVAASARTWTRLAITRARSVCRSGAPRPCGPPVTTSPRCWPCSAWSPPGTRRRGASPTSSRSRWPSWAGPGST